MSELYVIFTDDDIIKSETKCDAHTQQVQQSDQVDLGGGLGGAQSVRDPYEKGQQAGHVAILGFLWKNGEIFIHLLIDIFKNSARSFKVFSCIS